MLSAKYRIVHRFVPGTNKHGNRTACGIALVASEPMPAPGSDILETPALNGGYITVTAKGDHYDCPRCRAVIETFMKGRFKV